MPRERQLASFISFLNAFSDLLADRLDTELMLL